MNARQSVVVNPDVVLVRIRIRTIREAGAINTPAVLIAEIPKRLLPSLAILPDSGILLNGFTNAAISVITEFVLEQLRHEPIGSTATIDERNFQENILEWRLQKQLHPMNVDADDKVVRSWK